MKSCSLLAMLKRNHLPIVSVLGCISCLYILSQKDSFNEELEMNSRGIVSSGYRREEHIPNAPLVLKQNDKPVIEQAKVAIVEPVNPPVVAADPIAVQQNPVAPVQVVSGGSEVSYHDPERVAFPGYEKCAKVDFQPEHAMSLVALAVYMSSGDVILRQRLQAATGIYTGTWDSNEGNYPRAKSGVFLGSTVDYKLGRTVFAKTQIAQPEHIVTFEGGALLVIRNPRRMIAAEYIRRKKEAEPGRKYTQEELASWFQQPDWKPFFQTEVGNWRSFAIQWVTYAKRLLIVSYEYFLDDPVQETTRIIVFLNTQQDDERISCSIQAYPLDHVDNALTFDPYTDEMNNLMTTYIQEVNQTIHTRGLRPLPTWK